MISSFFFILILLLVNARIKNYCHEDDQTIIKPKNSTFYDTRYTHMLRDTFFLGTGTEFLFRGNGKLVMLFSLVK